MNVPYFYIIQHNISKKLYAGCQYSKTCHPDNLLKKYFTSSKLVKEIITQEQCNNFVIVSIITEFGDMSEFIEQHKLQNVPLSYVYETKYLIEHNCTKSTEWLNFRVHEYEKVPGFDTQYSKELYLLRYGVDNPSKSELVKDKKQVTCMKNYGVEHPSYSEECCIKRNNTNLMKYGSENPFGSKQIQQKISNECMDSYGVLYHQSRPEIREKISKALTGIKRSPQFREQLSKNKQGLVAALNTNTEEQVIITKEEYKNNPHNYVGRTAIKKEYIDQQTNERFLLYKNNPLIIDNNLILASSIKKVRSKEQIHMVKNNVIKKFMKDSLDEMVSKGWILLDNYIPKGTLPILKIIFENDDIMLFNSNRECAKHFSVTDATVISWYKTTNGTGFYNWIKHGIKDVIKLF